MATEAMRGRIRIPVTFEAANTLSSDAFDAKVDETALILVDCWNYGDPKAGEAPSPRLARTRDFLARCRAARMTIIHAPNHPVVDRYPQYEAIRDEVGEWLAKKAEPQDVPEHLAWPPRDNDVYEQARAFRAAGSGVRPRDGRDISRLLTPLEDEYVLATHDEFRYVLWRRGIKLLLYVGGALNECLQHRDTGVNLLIGSDSRRTAFTVVLVRDCCSSTSSPRLTDEEMNTAMLDYFQRKVAFLTQSDEIRFP